MDFVLVGMGLGALLIVARAVVSWMGQSMPELGMAPLPWSLLLRRRERARKVRVLLRMLAIAGTTLLLTVVMLLVAGVTDRVGMVVIVAEIAALILASGYWVFLIASPAWRPHRPPPVPRRPPGRSGAR